MAERGKDDRFECELDADELKLHGPFSWMVRPCEWYRQEYKDCVSIRARVHQYFIWGHTISCDDWRDDYYNCNLYRKTKDPQYVNRIVRSELERKVARKKAELANDVWEYRTSPPTDWLKTHTKVANNKSDTTTTTTTSNTTTST